MASSKRSATSITQDRLLRETRSAYAKVLGLRPSDLTRDIYVYNKGQYPGVLITSEEDNIPGLSEGGERVTDAAQAILRKKLGKGAFIEQIDYVLARASAPAKGLAPSRRRRVSKNRRRTSRR